MNMNLDKKRRLVTGVWLSVFLLGIAGSISVQAEPTVKLTPKTVPFKNQTVKETSAEKVVTLKNTGDADLKNISIKITGTNKKDFKVTHDCGKTLAANKSCQIKITFTPTAEGDRKATLEISSNAKSSSDDKVELTGKGIQAQTSTDDKAQPKVQLTPVELNFGNNAINVSSEEETITMKNTGKADLKNIEVTIEPKDEFATFSTSSSSTCGSKLSAGKDCTIQVIFTSLQPGTHEATLKVTSNATTSPQVTLKGRGIPENEPVVKLTPATVEFGKQALSAIKTVTLKNKGAVELTDIQLTIEGEHQDEFATPATPCSSLDAGGECTIDITFTPTQNGKRQATLSVTSNASSSPDTVKLQGTGEGTDEDIDYPELGQAFAFDADGNIVETTIQFTGGVSLAVEDENGELTGTNFEPELVITLEQPIVVSGVLTSLPEEHIGQEVDIIALGFYVREQDPTGKSLLVVDGASSENCDPSLVETVDEGGYYMVQQRPDIYCDWIVEGGKEGWCIDQVPNARKKLEAPQQFFELWSGHLADLKKLDTVILTEPLKLSAENEQMIYQGKIDGTGHVCVYLGYRTQEGTLIFNGEETINIRVTE